MNLASFSRIAIALALVIVDVGTGQPARSTTCTRPPIQCNGAANLEVWQETSSGPILADSTALAKEWSVFARRSGIRQLADLAAPFPDHVGFALTEL
jgi:hypothetical protein